MGRFFCECWLCLWRSRVSATILCSQADSMLALWNIPVCLCVSKGYNFDISTCWIWLCVKNELLSGEHTLPRTEHNLHFHLPVLVPGQEQERTGDGHRHNWHSLGWGSGYGLSLPCLCSQPIQHLPFCPSETQHVPFVNVAPMQLFQPEL